MYSFNPLLTSKQYPSDPRGNSLKRGTVITLQRISKTLGELKVMKGENSQRDYLAFAPTKPSQIRQSL